jgi:hypothetical protein
MATVTKNRTYGKIAGFKVKLFFYIRQNTTLLLKMDSSITEFWRNQSELE